MEKKHDLLFCPQCGAKLDGDEILCPSCGYKLAEINPVNQTTVAPVVPPPVTVPKPPVIPPPPPIVPPLVPPIIPPVNSQKPLPGFTPKRPNKKGLGTGWIIIIIVIGLIVLGVGTVAFLQYNGSIDIEALRSTIPSKDNSIKPNTNISDPTRYYVAQSFTIVNSKWTAIVSDVVVSKVPYNNEEGAKNQFKKAIMVKYPKIWNLFADNIIVNKYCSFTEAENAHSNLIKTYDAKHYTINTINFGY